MPSYESVLAVNDAGDPQEGAVFDFVTDPSGLPQPVTDYQGVPLASLTSNQNGFLPRFMAGATRGYVRSRGTPSFSQLVFSNEALDGAADAKAARVAADSAASSASTSAQAAQASAAAAIAAAAGAGGGGTGGGVSNWTDLQGKPTTFPPIIGTTPTTAKAGNYTPPIADLPPGSTVTSQGQTTRPTARTDITVIFTSAADPGTNALNGDQWWH